MTGSPRPVRDTFCSFCGTKYVEPLAYPRSCASCKTMVWSNPIPVSVILVPVIDDGRTGLLVIRRAIPPGIGKLAIPGGFLEDDETWQEGGAREVREECAVVVEASTIEGMWWTSTRPKPNRVLLFGVAASQDAKQLPKFESDSETSERGLVFGPDGLDAEFAFDLHAEAARKFFAARGITGPTAFLAR